MPPGILDIRDTLRLNLDIWSMDMERIALGILLQDQILRTGEDIFINKNSELVKKCKPYTGWGYDTLKSLGGQPPFSLEKALEKRYRVARQVLSQNVQG